MNKERRKEIQYAIDNLQKIDELVTAARDALESAKDGEREYYDNMPEGLKNGEKGSQADSAATTLEEAFSKLEDLNVEDMIGELEGAME